MIRERVLRREQVEDEAFAVLLSYERDYSGSAAFPVDVDMIGEVVFGLTWEWDKIIEPAGNRANNSLIILAGLYPWQRRVVMNEVHVDVFRAKPGLERYTKGHEIGHWVLHIDKSAIDHPSLFDGEVDGELEHDTIICRDGDDTWIERQANWFSAGLLMPKTRFLEVVGEYDLTKWRARYDLAERFGVTISALSVRLNRFGLTYVDEHGTIHRSAVEARGQGVLG